jgi:stalled ribosome rescue protein Dom34
MSQYSDAIVFIDRHEAKVFHFSATDEIKLVVAHDSARRKHHAASHEDGTKHAVDDAFMQQVVESLDHSGDTLIAGPGNSKFELQTYMQQHAPALAKRISGIETLADPRDSGIVAIAREFFRTRGHRHHIKPDHDFRHDDPPTKP